MSKSAEIIVRYDSPVIKGGFISLDVLGPSLLSLGMLCNRANQIVNGDQVKSTALVNANINQNCFELIFQLDLSFVKDLLGREMKPIAILVLLGIVDGVKLTDFGVIKVGLFDLIKMKQGKDLGKTISQDEHNTVIQVRGDKNNITVSNNVFKMYNDPITRLHTQKFINKGLGSSERSSITFENKKNHKKKTNTREDFSDFINNGWEEQVKEEYKPQEVEAILTIYSPVFDQEASKWRFLYGDDRITVDISETDIAAGVMDRGGVSVNDRYKVLMEVIQYETKAGSIKNKYKATQVIEFLPAAEQGKFL